MLDPDVLSKMGAGRLWQRSEEATMCQRRPADPTDPGDAADLSIMGFSSGRYGSFDPRSAARFDGATFAKEHLEINTFLTNPRESLGLR